MEVDFKEGSSLSTRLRDAVRGRRRRISEFEELSASIPPETLSLWEAAVVNWHCDPGNYQDPYREITKEYTVADMKRVLAEDDSFRGFGGDVEAEGDMSPGAFLLTGLDLEEEQ